MHSRDPFNLGTLPEQDPPPELWQSIETRLQRPRRRLAWLALAAAVALAVGAGWLLVDYQHGQPVPAPGLDQYQRASSILEQRIDALQANVVEARVLEDLSRLEDQLAWVDYLLSEAPDDPDLWRHRLELLESIGGIYAGQAWVAQLEFTAL